jgi:hypothetical protein
VASNSSTNPLPLKIKIGGYCFGKKLDITLSQVTGNMSLVKSKVYTQNSPNATESSTFNLVILLNKNFIYI